MSEQPTAGTRRRAEITVLGGQPASLWFASLASLAMIIGAVAPWATQFGFISLSGTRMHSWSEVAFAVVGLAMLGLYALRGTRFALIVAAGAGVLGAMQAVATFGKLASNGAVTVFGVQYHFLDPAWGLYVVLVGAIGLAGSSTLAWFAARATA